jgi:hypothetical protein
LLTRYNICSPSSLLALLNLHTNFTIYAQSKEITRADLSDRIKTEIHWLTYANNRYHGQRYYKHQRYLIYVGRVYFYFQLGFLVQTILYFLKSQKWLQRFSQVAVIPTICRREADCRFVWDPFTCTKCFRYVQ